MKTTQDLRAVVRAELGCNDVRIDEILRVGRSAGLADDDALATAWLAARDPMHYAGRRGPQPRDPLLRAVEVEAERQSTLAAEWDASTPAALAAAELLVDSIASSWGRGRRNGTRPQAERRAAARREQAATAGQANFSGFGWGATA